MGTICRWKSSADETGHVVSSMAKSPCFFFWSMDQWWNVRTSVLFETFLSSRRQKLNRCHLVKNQRLNYESNNYSSNVKTLVETCWTVIICSLMKDIVNISLVRDSADLVKCLHRSPMTSSWIHRSRLITRNWRTCVQYHDVLECFQIQSVQPRRRKNTIDIRLLAFLRKELFLLNLLSKF